MWIRQLNKDKSIPSGKTVVDLERSFLKSLCSDQKAKSKSVVMNVDSPGSDAESTATLETGDPNGRFRNTFSK